MTLQEIKDEYARGKGYANYDDLRNALVMSISLEINPRDSFDLIEFHLNEINTLYTTTCIQNDRDLIINNISYTTDEEYIGASGDEYGRLYRSVRVVDKQSILNTPIELL